MADDVLTRNSADELALRVVQSSGDTGMNKDDVYTRDSQGRLSVRTVGGADYSAEIEALNNAVSVLETSVDLSTEIGGKTTVALGDLTAMDIDGRPSYKEAGATVYAENGVVGIIDSVDSTNAIITTVSTSLSVEKGHTWTKSQVIENNGNVAGLFLNFGALADGNYEFLIKNPDKVSTTVWGVRFRIADGAVNFYNDTSFYFPLPQLASGAVNRYAARDFVGAPVGLRKIDNNWKFWGSNWNASSGPASANLEVSQNQTFEFTDLLNLDTGEYIAVVENSIYYDENYPVEVGEAMELEGRSAYAPPTINVPSYATSTGWGADDYVDPSRFYAINLDLVDTGWDLNQDSYMGGTGYRAKNRIYMVNRETKDVCLLELSVCVGTISAKVIRATGIFAGLDWKVAWNNAVGNYRTSYFIYADGFKFINTIYSMAFYGSTGDDTYRWLFLTSYATKPTYENEISFTKEQAPTADLAAYTLCHDSGVIEMGGIVPITDTLQPNVALGNVPVVFPNELANANFVPTITVMTDGTFKQVMADVANPTTTGFDLCVRNVDTEAVSNIKIAWKIVGTNK